MAEEPYRNPASAYVDPVRSHREIEVLFRGRPTLVALSPDLPATGEFLTTEVADIPLLLLRGEDGVVRCYLNARGHRGGRVAGPSRSGIRMPVPLLDRRLRPRAARTAASPRVLPYDGAGLDESHRVAR